jgi:hypothetical protein
MPPLRLAYRDLAVSEEVWSLMDPSGAVPRNPLTVVLDATAQVQLMVDLMSAEAMEWTARRESCARCRCRNSKSPSAARP